MSAGVPQDTLTDWTRYCCRCGSDIGYKDDKPRFCLLCWQDRVPVPKGLLAELARVSREHETMRNALAEIAAKPYRAEEVTARLAAGSRVEDNQ